MEESTPHVGPALEGPRPARPDELPAVVDLVDEVFCRAAGRPPTMAKQFPHLLSPENAENLFIITEDGRPVSHVGLWMGTVGVLGVRLPVASMGSVCTLPEARSRGLADRLVRQAFGHVRAQGRPLLFISGTRSLYRRNGAHPAGRFRDLTFTVAGEAGTIRRPPRRLAVTLRPARLPDDAPVLAALHQREPVRWHRRLDEWAVLVEAAGFATVLGLGQELWLVERKGEPVACWVTASGPSLPGELLVLEFFGSRAALAAGLDPLFHRARVDRVHVPVLEGDPLLHALPAAGWAPPEAAPEPLPGTVAVTDWPLLWRRLRPALEERLPSRWAGARAYVRGGAPASAGPRGYGLKAPGGETWEVEGEERLVQALFGAGPSPGEERRPLRQPLSHAFPIPLPWPCGLNYV